MLKKGAIRPNTQSFKDSITAIDNILIGKENENILLYCTGGIRCTKLGGYLKQSGFNNVKQLFGGIQTYANHLKKYNLQSEYIGSMFTFDNRLSERITSDILTTCITCGDKHDRIINCGNVACHLLIIQCPQCSLVMRAACSETCKDHILWKERDPEGHKAFRRNIGGTIIPKKERYHHELIFE